MQAPSCMCKTIFVGILPKWSKKTGLIWYDYRQGWGAAGCHRRLTIWNGNSSIYTHTRAHTQKRISFQTEAMAGVRSAAGQAAVHVLLQLALVIHKLELTPVVWCHLHHLLVGLVFNMGPLWFLRALCCRWGAWYMRAISGQVCIYLSVNVSVS